MRAIEFARQAMRVPHRLIELNRRLAIADPEDVLYAVPRPLGLALLQLAPEAILGVARRDEDHRIDLEVELALVVAPWHAAGARAQEIGSILEQIRDASAAGLDALHPMIAERLDLLL